jgi:hypothetical protein
MSPGEAALLRGWPRAPGGIPPRCRQCSAPGSLNGQNGGHGLAGVLQEAAKDRAQSPGTHD